MLTGSPVELPSPSSLSVGKKVASLDTLHALSNVLIWPSCVTQGVRVDANIGSALLLHLHFRGLPYSLLES